MVAASLKDSPEAIIPIGNNLALLRCAAIYGANGSGKSTVLMAFAFMCRAIEESHRSWGPADKIRRLTPFNPDRRKTSRFEVDVYIDGILYQYGFVANAESFEKEWLNAYPNDRKQEWFSREGREFKFGKHFKGSKTALASLTRPNSLFLSAAAQNNQELLIPLYKWFSDKVYVFSHERGRLAFETASRLEEEATMVNRASELLRAADLGLCGLTVSQKPVPERTRELARAVASVMGMKSEAEDQNRLENQTLPEVSLRHVVKGEGEFLLSLDDESDGTQTFFALLGPVLDSLDKGTTLFVDELDASLHPLLCLKIVALFNSPITNPKGAQFIFTTHDTSLLSQSDLRRDQLWFTEKDEFGATHLYPLTDFKPRINENLERGYLQGRYGAIPILGDFQRILSEPH